MLYRIFKKNNKIVNLQSFYCFLNVSFELSLLQERMYAYIEISKLCESADKPGSVVDNHSSWAYVTINLMQPTRTQCEQHY